MAKRFRADVNPSILRWARESAGLDVDQAAAKIKRSAAEVRAWEAGETRPTIPQARRAAEVYKRPLAAFYFSETPRAPADPSDFRRVAGDSRRDFSPELRLLIRQARNKQRWASQWKSQRGDNPLNFVGSWKDLSRPEALSSRIRKELGIDRGAVRGLGKTDAFNAWYDRVEFLGIYVIRSRTVKPDEARGFALSDKYAPLVFVNANDSKSAMMFTLMHEVVHIWLGASTVSNPNVPGKFPTAGEAIEVFCNRVASLILMPSNLAKPIIEEHGDNPQAAIGRLCATFKVSPESAARRLLDLGMVDQDFYESVRRQSQHDWTAFRDQQREKAKLNPPKIQRSVLVASWNGDAFTHSVITALNRDDITIPDALNLLDTRLKHLDALEERSDAALHRRELE